MDQFVLLKVQQGLLWMSCICKPSLNQNHLFTAFSGQLLLPKI